MRLRNRIALVTGASRGIGRAIAVEFAREGADVAVNYRKQAAAAEETAAAIQALGRRVVVIQADIADAEACRRMVADAERALGPLDIAVANGGVASRPGMIADLPVEEWHRVLATDLHGCFYTVKAVIGGMLERGRGVVLTVSSIGRPLRSRRRALRRVQGRSERPDPHPRQRGGVTWHPGQRDRPRRGAVRQWASA